jgi:hypothetical protein
VSQQLEQCQQESIRRSRDHKSKNQQLVRTVQTEAAAEIGLQHPQAGEEASKVPAAKRVPVAKAGQI